ncbi:MAG TPA: histone deacetylase [Mycobacterium sp.]|nr:histone deacetylase [Mycobacterium sp.]HUH71579.1 histone deacetylase [Mycobacterium sp.]
MAERRTIYATHQRYVEHDCRGHPENAERIRAVWRGLDESGLSARMQPLQAPAIDTDLIRTLHSADYLELLRRVSAMHSISFLDADTYAGSDALTIARLSAGGVVGAVDGVLSGSADNGLAAIRPPGHHAMPNRGMGFCLLGNVAIAARYAQLHHGIERVLIVDYDVHHGNGTEAMFYEDPSVLYISTHQHPFYPGAGTATDIGAGRGKGYTINIPLPAGSGDANYATVFERIIWGAAERFGPQLILVSAGFDAYWADPLAGMRLTLSGFSHLAGEVMWMAQQCCEGRVVFALEGGYDLDALRYAVSNVARVLLGEAPNDPLGPPPGPQSEPDISALLSRLQTLHGL